jgi:hypothetical protein
MVRATDRGGDKWLEVSADESAVLDLLAQFPQFNAGDGRFAVAYGPSVFNVDDSTYREALTLAGHDSWEAGNPAGHRAAQERWNTEPDARNDPSPDANVRNADPTVDGAQAAIPMHDREGAADQSSRHFIARPARGKASHF